jgi:hypothetical protein
MFCEKTHLPKPVSIRLHKNTLHALVVYQNLTMTGQIVSLDTSLPAGPDHSTRGCTLQWSGRVELWGQG